MEDFLQPLTLPKKACISCAEPIPTGAIKCGKCGSSQNSLRHLTVSQNILSLLIALFAVLGLSIEPFITHVLTPKTDTLDFQFAHISKANAPSFLIKNSGSSHGLVSSLIVEFNNLDNTAKCILYYSSLNNSDSSNVVPPLDASIVKFIYSETRSQNIDEELERSMRISMFKLDNNDESLIRQITMNRTSVLSKKIVSEPGFNCDDSEIPG